MNIACVSAKAWIKKSEKGETMRELFEVINQRYSYRGIYEETKVPREDLKRILEAGLAAPSGCNKQTTSLIAVDDEEVLGKLQSVIPIKTGKTAPAMICVLTKKIIAHDDRTYQVQDYAAAIENMLLAITALGYATCWIEGQVTGPDCVGRKMADILGVPEEYSLVCMLPVGVAAEEGPRKEKMSFEERAWFNQFGSEK